MKEKPKQVSVFSGDELIERLNLPSREMFGKPFVTYKDRLYPLESDGTIRIQVSTAASKKSSANPKKTTRVFEPDARKDKPDKWSPEQEEVIDSDGDRKLLVAAPPGSGKTATACARVASLIEVGGLQPHNIWVVSFTTAAVEEIRSRIALYLETPDLAHAIRISTLDSLAWILRSGFDEKAALTGSYADNIASALELLKKDPQLKAAVQEISHVIVDEAQDFFGERAELVLEFLRRLSSSAGYTVLGDEAQAIYGFSNDEGETNSPVDHLIDLLRDISPKPDEIELEDVFRFETPSLAKLVRSARTLVLKTKDEGVSGALAGLIREHAQGSSSGLTAAVSASSVILYRRRVDVLAAGLVPDAPVARFRLSGFSAVLAPFIGACLFDFPGPKLSRAEFEKRFTERVSQGTSRPSFDEIWSALLRLAGDGRGIVDTRRLRAGLSRRGLPVCLASADIGTRGPLLSTIHAYKGREAEEVHLMIPPDSQDHEEAKVLLVGATRARKNLKIGELKNAPVGNHKGRAFRGFRNYHSALIELGRDGDIDADAMVGTTMHSSPHGARAVHDRLANLADGQVIQAEANFSMNRGKRYILSAAPQGHEIGALSLGWTIWDVMRKVEGADTRRKPGMKMGNIKVFGARTLVLPVDHPMLEELHDPWRQSGFVLAPVAAGFCFNNFR